MILTALSPDQGIFYLGLPDVLLHSKTRVAKSTTRTATNTFTFWKQLQDGGDDLQSQFKAKPSSQVCMTFPTLSFSFLAVKG